MKANVKTLKQLAALPNLSPAMLDKKWKEFFDTAPPTWDKRAMVRKLAHRVQELAYGGMTERGCERMKIKIQQEGLIGRTPSKQDGMPVVGTRLLREWKGVQHSVTVTPNGFEYQGCPFRSLSAVAKAITGTQWNGFIFFGIRRQNAGGDK
ncbi:MAG: DUF2924 domain-containing protein [Magnetococcus sp. YQC-3]